MGSITYKFQFLWPFLSKNRVGARQNVFSRSALIFHPILLKTFLVTLGIIPVILIPINRILLEKFGVVLGHPDVFQNLGTVFTSMTLEYLKSQNLQCTLQHQVVRPGWWNWPKQNTFLQSCFTTLLFMSRILW